MSLAFKLFRCSLPFHRNVSYSSFSIPIPVKTTCKTPNIVPTSCKTSAMASRTCSKCTLLNNNTANSCEICNSSPNDNENRKRSASHPPQLVSEWPCKACTFLNKLGRSKCEICGDPASGTLSSLLIDDDDDEREEKGAGVGKRFRPLQSCSQGPPPPARTDEQNRPSRLEKEEEEGWVDMKKAPKTSAPAPAYTCTSSVTNTFLRNLHMDRMLRASQSGTDSKVEAAESSHEIEYLSSTSENNGEKETGIVFLTYNVWFREDLEVHGRMRALGDLIEQHQPHFICFQEVTPNIYEIFCHSSWWAKYWCSVSPQLAKMRAYFCVQLSRLPVADFRRNPFRNSIMGRELCLADVETGMGKQLVIVTTHLESPSPAPPKWDQMYSAERVFQAKESFNLLKNLPNVIFGGDMNWDDRLDGIPPLPDGWYDAWVKLKPGQVGWTYDTKSNKMLTGNRLLQKRLDRIFCHLQDFDIESIDMIGTDPIPGLSHTKEKKTRNQSQILTLPVLPSDHYGLLLKLRLKK